jgi:prepilin signal peptidase PulO-like enzyme (type II secretory pathway)
MEAFRFLCAALSAVAIAAAVHGWLRRQPLPALAGAPPDTSSHSNALRLPLRPRWGGAVLLHSGALVPLALLLAWVDRGAPFLAFSQSLLLLFLLYPLAVLDWLTLEVELRLVLAGLLVRIGALIVFDRPQTPGALLGMLAGAGMITLAALAYRALRGRAGLGEGDAGVLAISGAFVGLSGLVPVLFLAASAGVLLGVTGLLFLRKPMDTPIPFVPFLCAATLVVYVAQRLGWQGPGMG